ncbi:hypothetical protein QPR60_12270 [Enterobacter hormaechei]|uniref:Uncharacterized protein n=1 Tax=Enterobacter hormaechei TaxID=158836 RepID=A0AAX3YXQ9_9ENTR|nr:hypothetical protein [Enterobacter hormaechei]WMB09396.1 hypothetical protein QPR60_12270 [Enterobacter hormaechei]
MTSDIALSGVACTLGVTPRQLVQSSSENDIWIFFDVLAVRWSASGGVNVEGTKPENPGGDTDPRYE